jgi:hypothetical protein
MSAAPSPTPSPTPPPTPPPPPPPRERIDLTITVPQADSDAVIDEICNEEADAGILTNEIIVCRRLGQASDGYWNKGEWEARYAAETQGGSTPNVAGDGIFSGPATISGQCFLPPCPGDPALMIDIEALPTAPEGSDADRIARGLPPLGEQELSAEEIAKRRRALGLDAPPLPEE